jgi:hypothetical protein
MKKSFFTIAFMFIGFYVFSQNEVDKKTKTDLSEIRKNTYQLDLDVKNVNSIKLLRITAKINSQTNLNDKSADTNFASYRPVNKTDVGIGFGFEKQIKNKNFVHYFGIDAIGSYQTSETGTYLYYYSETLEYNFISTYDIKTKLTKVGVNPFFGIKYYITDKISVGIETGFEFSFFNNKTNQTQYLPRLVKEGVKIDIIEYDPRFTNGILARFNNLRFATVGYVF